MSSRQIVKKKLFQVTDTGDFVDSVYNESTPNVLYSNLIGRSQILPNTTSQFSASEISYEGKLFKRGTYYKSWKERYFILRRDLHKLCYYDARDTLVLLGSIELKPTSHVCRVNPEDADDYGNAFCILESSESLLAHIDFVFIMSAHSSLELQQWIECLTAEIADVREATARQRTGRAATWWDHLFDKAPEVTPAPGEVQLEVKKMKEQALSNAYLNSINNANNSTEPTHFASLTLPPLEEDEDGEDNDNDVGRDAQLSPGQRVNRVPSDIPAYISPEMKQRRSKRLSTTVFREPKLEKLDKRLGPPPMDASLAPKFLAGPSEARFVQCLQVNLKAKFACGSGDQLYVSLARLTPSMPVTPQADKDGDKPSIHGFRSTLVNTRNRSLRTTASSAIAAAEAAPPGCEWCLVGRTEVYLVSEQTAPGRRLVEEILVSFSLPFPALPSTSEIYQISLCRSKDAGGGMTENADGGSDSMSSSAANSPTVCLARGTFLRKRIESISLAVIPLETVRFLTESVSEESRDLVSVSVGIVQLRSHSLLQFRQKLQGIMNFPPYAEALFAPSTVGGRCLCMEQIFVSRHPVSVGSELCTLFLKERRPYVHTLLTQVEGDDEAVARSVNPNALHSQGSSMLTASRRLSGMDIDERVMVALIKIESYGKALNALDSICKQQLETLRLARNHCRVLDAGGEGVTNGTAMKRLNKIVLPESVGGLYLRRSVWKEPDRWQFCTMNLNIHLLTAQRLSSQELQQSAIANASSQSTANDPFVLPTITLGVPAAHRLDFSDGGLRKIFGRLPSDSSRLLWMAALQGPHSYDSLAQLFERCPRERAVLFPQTPSLVAQQKEEIMCVALKRRYELTERLDMCGSQALGLAITVVQTVLRLAALGVKEQYDVLCRSLRVGFLISCEGFLSSWDAELGMIEDADIAMLWLSLLTLRLVIRGEGVSEQHRERQQPKVIPSRPTGPLTGPPPPCETQLRDDGVKELVNTRHGAVTVRRDVESGRLIVDLEVSRAEADVIRAAQEEMVGMRYDASTSTAQSPFPLLHTASAVVTQLTEVLSPANLRSLGSGASTDRHFENIFVAPTRFNPHPSVRYDGTNEVPEILAVVELTGVLFNQGVNAWQTIANWIRDVSRQADVNRSSLARLREYYNRHRTALMYQLLRREVTSSTTSPTNQGPFTPTSSTHIPPSLYSVQFMPTQYQSTHGVGAPPSTPSTASSKQNNRNSFNLNRNSFRLGGGTHTRSTMPGLSMCDVAIVEADRLMQEAEVAVELACNRPSDIHVHVLLKTSAICRHLAGTIAVFCKSGKDRTAMGVTLDMTRCLVEAEGVLAGKAFCNVLRVHGCRRMNVYANTGQPMYAFGTLDRRALPNCYVPPANICNGNVHG